MSGLYQWHTVFVAGFLGFVLLFVLAQARRGPGGGGQRPGNRGRGPGR